LSKNSGISPKKTLSYLRKGKKNCFLAVEKKNYRGKKKKEKEEMQKKLRKEI
jgi:hypothetical protein